MKLTAIFVLVFMFIACGGGGFEGNKSTDADKIYTMGESLNVSSGNSIESLSDNTKLDITTDALSGQSKIIILSGSIKYIK